MEPTAPQWGACNIWTSFHIRPCHNGTHCSSVRTMHHMNIISYQTILQWKPLLPSEEHATSEHHFISDYVTMVPNCMVRNLNMLVIFFADGSSYDLDQFSSKYNRYCMACPCGQVKKLIYHKISNIRHKIPELKWSSSCLAVVFAQSIEARC